MTNSQTARCPIINLGYMQQVPQAALKLPNQKTLEVMFQICVCIKEECKFFDPGKEECKIILFLDRSIGIPESQKETN